MTALDETKQEETVKTSSSTADAAETAVAKAQVAENKSNSNPKNA